MKDKRILVLDTVLVLLAMVVAMAFLAGCESVGEALYTGTYNYTSASTEEGQVYTFYNNSSHPVTLSDDTGSHTLSPGESFSARLNRSASVYNVDYSPSDLVAVSQSGTVLPSRTGSRRQDHPTGSVGCPA
jgi:hypothetical protein